MGEVTPREGEGGKKVLNGTKRNMNNIKQPKKQQSFRSNHPRLDVEILPTHFFFFTRLFVWNPIVAYLISWVCQIYPFASFTETFMGMRIIVSSCTTSLLSDHNKHDHDKELLSLSGRRRDVNLPALLQRPQLSVREAPRLAAPIRSDGVELVERRHDEKVAQVVLRLPVRADIRRVHRAGC